jgi:hypothetical protein
MYSLYRQDANGDCEQVCATCWFRSRHYFNRGWSCGLCPTDEKSEIEEQTLPNPAKTTAPTSRPTAFPTAVPTAAPITAQTTAPTSTLTASPSKAETAAPTSKPTADQTHQLPG